MKLFLSSTALAIVLAAGSAQAQQISVKIGVLTDLTGLYSDNTGKGTVAEYLQTLTADGREQGIRYGANVTMPHKDAAFALSRPDARAQAVGAANTLWLEGGELRSTNTDVEGFIDNLDVSAPGWDRSKHALVLGAGGGVGLAAVQLGALLGAPQARGKAFVNLLPLSEGETISAVMPMPEDEASWSTLHVMFATARGGARRWPRRR